MDARQTIASLRRRLKDKDQQIERLQETVSAIEQDRNRLTRELESSRNELARIKNQSCYRIENHDPATVEHGEWQAETKLDG